MRKEKDNTDQQISKLIELRQAVYKNSFTRRKDAQLELLDALLLKDQIASFPMLSCSTAFTRRWQSAYAALEKGQQDTTWLRSYLAKQVPEKRIQFFSLDCTAWERPEAHTLPDRQYVYQPSRTNKGSLAVIGHAYSLLDWVPETNSSWSLSVDVERVSSEHTDLEKEEPPAPLWLAWQAPAIMPEGIRVNAETIWQAYQHRWPIKPSIRFRKQRLWWTLPQFQLVEAADRWSVLVSLAMWMLYLARPIVQDQPLPWHIVPMSLWEKPQRDLTPGRVKRGIGTVFRAIGNPASSSKSRGIPPGWPKGKPRKPRERFSVIRKGPKQSCHAVSMA